MATIKEIINQCGGITKFCSRTGIPYITVQFWRTDRIACKDWLIPILEYALLNGYDRHLKVDSKNKKFKSGEE